MSTTYTVTNSFVAGTTAVASQVNQNFTDILTALNSFDASNLGSSSVPLARISGLTTSQFATNVVDTDGTLAANSDTRFSSQKAIKTYVGTYADAAPAAQMTPTSYAGEESVTFPNGLVFKQGYSTSKTITFSAAFATGIISASVTMRRTDLTSQSATVGALATTGFTIYVGDALATGYYWQAWGY